MVSVGSCINEPPSYRDTVIYGILAVPFVDDRFGYCVCVCVCMKHGLYDMVKGEFLFWPTP
jgi:hypothetical protein